MNLPRRKGHDECFNAISHWIGVPIGIVGLVFLLYFGIKDHNPGKIASFSIYGGSFIFLYLVSAIYHTIQKERPKRILRVFDHGAIFLFIAGSYTPIIILSFQGIFRIAMIVAVWAIALFGIGFKIFTFNRFDTTKRISLFLYLSLGWMAILMAKPIIENTSIQFLILLAVGGVFYTIGTFFYSNKKIPYHHGIWHIFVLAGSIVHYSGILQLYALG